MANKVTKEFPRRVIEYKFITSDGAVFTGGDAENRAILYEKKLIAKRMRITLLTELMRVFNESLAIDNSREMHDTAIKIARPFLTRSMFSPVNGYHPIQTMERLFLLLIDLEKAFPGRLEEAIKFVRNHADRTVTEG